MAHVGGFLAGIAMTFLFACSETPVPPSSSGSCLLLARSGHPALSLDPKQTSSLNARDLVAAASPDYSRLCAKRLNGALPPRTRSHFSDLLWAPGGLGAERDPLSGIFLIPLGMPWTLFIGSVGKFDPFGGVSPAVLAMLAPAINLAILFSALRRRRFLSTR